MQKTKSEIVNEVKRNQILAAIDSYNYKKEINEKDTAIEDQILVDTLHIIVSARADI
jgi:hypothetical protein